MKAEAASLRAQALLGAQRNAVETVGLHHQIPSDATGLRGRQPALAHGARELFPEVGHGAHHDTATHPRTPALGEALAHELHVPNVLPRRSGLLLPEVPLCLRPDEPVGRGLAGLSALVVPAAKDARLAADVDRPPRLAAPTVGRSVMAGRPRSCFDGVKDRAAFVAVIGPKVHREIEAAQTFKAF